MGSVTDSFDVILEGPDLFAGRPRLRRLTWGVLCVLGALLLWGLQGTSVWWDRAAGADARMASGLLAAAGAALALHAATSQGYRLQQVRISAQGLRLVWSHVPRLGGPRIAQECFLGWDEVKSIEWLEGTQDHDFTQYLALELSGCVASRWHRLKLPVSDERSVDRCQALACWLPPGVAGPAWLDAARSRRA